MSHPFMTAVADGLGERGVAYGMMGRTVSLPRIMLCRRYQFPPMEKGGKRSLPFVIR
jgi:hypothetical protein